MDVVLIKDLHQDTSIFLSPKAVLHLYALGYRDNVKDIISYLGNNNYLEKALNSWRKYLREDIGNDRGRISAYVFTPDEKHFIWPVIDSLMDIEIRSHPLIVKTVRDLEHSECKNFKVVTIPDHTNFCIGRGINCEYIERTWRSWNENI